MVISIALLLVFYRVRRFYVGPQNFLLRGPHELIGQLVAVSGFVDFARRALLSDLVLDALTEVFGTGLLRIRLMGCLRVVHLPR